MSNKEYTGGESMSTNSDVSKNLVEEESNNTTIGKKIDFVERFGYGAGDLAINFVWASMGLFIVYFYTDVVGISAGIVGTIMLISRFWDGISDVLMGVIVDRTNTKYGKARPWILWMCAPFSIFAVLLFTVPDVTARGQIVYAFITYNILVLVFTSVVIPYGTLNSLITQDQHERSILNIFRMFLAQCGVLIVSNLTLPLVEIFGGDQSGWVTTYTIYGIVGVMLFLLTFKVTKERVGVVEANREEVKEKIPFKVGIKALLRNKYWVIIFGFFITHSMATALWQGSTVYFAQYLLNNSTLTGILTVGITVPVIIGLFFMPTLFKKYGKRNIVMAGSVVSIIGTFIIMIDMTSVYIVILGQVIRGFGISSFTGALWAFLPDVIEYGEYKTKVRNEGLVYSAGSMGQKVGNGFGGALVGWILGWTGYVGGATVQPSIAITGINALFIYLPLITYFLNIVLLLFYKLDKIYPQIEAELLNRKKQ